MRYSGDAYSFQFGMQLLMCGEKWSYYWWVGQMSVVVNLVLQLLFPIQTLNNFLQEYFRDAAPCQWGRVAVMVWAGDGSNLRGWGGLMLIQGEG